jgi:hypothetical protein
MLFAGAQNHTVRRLRQCEQSHTSPPVGGAGSVRRRTCAWQWQARCSGAGVVVAIVIVSGGQPVRRAGDFIRERFDGRIRGTRGR